MLLPRDLDEEDAPLSAPLHLGALTLWPSTDDGSLPSGAPPSGAPSFGAIVALPARGAFGSGRHPTTRLLLDSLVARVRPGMRVLDVGTGSGVLALAAARLGATALGIDHDRAAIAAAIEGRRASGIPDAAAQHDPAAPQHHPSGSAHFLVGDAALLTASAGPFDLVVANLPARALCACAPALVALLAPRGLLLVSGALLPEARRVERAFLRSDAATATAAAAAAATATATATATAAATAVSPGVSSAPLAVVERSARAGWVRLVMKRD